MIGTVEQAADQEHVDVATVRRDIHLPGCPVIKKGKRGPGNGALLDLEKYREWRGKTNAPVVGLTPQEILQQIASALLQAVEHDRLDIRAGITKEEAAAACLVIFERCCKSFGISFKFDERPEPIRALAREL